MKKISEPECTKHELFKYFTDEERKKLEETSREVNYKAGELIFKEKSPSNLLVFLRSGMAKSYREGSDNASTIIRIIKPFEIIGLLASYNNSIHIFSLQALEDSVCCYYDMNLFKSLSSNNVKVLNFLSENICKRAMEYIDSFTSFATKHVNGRIAEALLYLSNQIYNCNPFTLNISRKDLADLTGMSKDTVVRVLKIFHNDKIIKVKEDQITILDFKKLEYISQKG